MYSCSNNLNVSNVIGEIVEVNVLMWREIGAKA